MIKSPQTYSRKCKDKLVEVCIKFRDEAPLLYKLLTVTNVNSESIAALKVPHLSLSPVSS